MTTLAMQSVVQTMMCGDEVKSCVLDMGYSMTRLGFGGHEMPRYSFRSDIGIKTGKSGSCGMDVDQKDDSAPSPAKKSRKSSSSSSSSKSKSNTPSSVPKNEKPLIGDSALRFINDYTDIGRPFSFSGDGFPISINWDHVESIMQYGFCDYMRIDPTDYCGYFTESHFATNLEKSKLFELAFERFEMPACYTMSNAALSSFSAGKPTSLIIDYGASHTTVSPVVDGHVLNRAVCRTRRGGNWLDMSVQKELKDRNVTIKPWFELDSHKGKYNPCSASLRALHVDDIVRDVKKWMSFVPYQPIPAEKRVKFFDEVVKLPTYELPDGSMISHSDTLCTGPEKFFIPADPAIGVKSIPRPQVNMPTYAQIDNIDMEADSLQELIRASILRCDVDCRKDLLSNISCVGGGAQIDGVVQRLEHEVKLLFPSSLKVKANVQLPQERYNAAWIGASILSICGSFQQIWISKQEWLEYGDSLFAHRLK